MFLYIVTLCSSTLLRYVPLHCYAMFLYIVKLCSSTLLRYVPLHCYAMFLYIVTLCSSTSLSYVPLLCYACFILKGIAYLLSALLFITETKSNRSVKCWWTSTHWTMRSNCQNETTNQRLSSSKLSYVKYMGIRDSMFNMEGIKCWLTIEMC